MKRSWYVFFFQQASAEAAFQANDFAFIDSLWRDWSPHWNSKNEHLASVKNTFRKEGTTAAAVNYYRQSFGNYNLNDQELMKIQEAFYRQSPFTVPALYFHGKEDGCIGVENVEGMEHFFSNKFEKHIIDEAGHFVHLEKPQIVNRYILEFLKSIR